MLPRVRYRKRSHNRVISTRHDQPSAAAAPASSHRESETSRTVPDTRPFRTPRSACHPAAAAAVGAAAPESPRPAADAAADSPESRRPAAADAIAAGSPESPRPAAPFARPSASCPFCPLPSQKVALGEKAKKRKEKNSPRPNPHRRLHPHHPHRVHHGVRLAHRAHHLVPRAFDRRPGRVHRALEAAGEEEALDCGDFEGDGGG